MSNFFYFKNVDFELKSVLDFIGAKRIYRTKYDIQTVQSRDLLKLLYYYFFDIEYSLLKKEILNSHDISGKVYTILSTKKGFRLKDLSSKFKNEDPINTYGEYLEITQGFQIEQIDTSELIKISEGENSYFSKPFIQALKEKFDEENEVHLHLIEKNNIKTIKLEIIDKNTKFQVGLYDISYNPPNGNPRKK